MDFALEVEKLLRQVPRAKVTTFSAIARALGDLEVRRDLRRVLQEQKPAGWHRVVGDNGRVPSVLSLAELQKEGVTASSLIVDDIEARKFVDFESDQPLKALREEQRALAPLVDLEDRLEKGGTVGGFDVSYRGNRAFAAAVVMDWEGREVLEEVVSTTEVTFPYISTYLAYREFEPVKSCYCQLGETPALLLIDGNGVLHPERFGLASMVGVRLGKPTIGVAKTLLLGTLDRNPEIGGASPIREDQYILGYALRETPGKPVYISPGHMISPWGALTVVKRLCRARLPEPLRRAHMVSARSARKSAA